MRYPAVTGEVEYRLLAEFARVEVAVGDDQFIAKEMALGDDLTRRGNGHTAVLVTIATSPLTELISALPPKADLDQPEADVRFCQSRTSPRSTLTSTLSPIADIHSIGATSKNSATSEDAGVFSRIRFPTHCGIGKASHVGTLDALS